MPAGRSARRAARAPAASAHGRAHRPARRRRGTAIGASHRRHSAGRSQRSSASQPRAQRQRSAASHRGPHDLDRRGRRPGTSARSAAAPCATSTSRPSAARRPRRAHGADPRRLARARTPGRAPLARAARHPAASGRRIVRAEAERRGVDDHGARGRPAPCRDPESPRPAPRSARGALAPSGTRPRRAAPARAAATAAARAPPPVPTISHGPGGRRQRLERREQPVDVGVVADHRSVLAPERVARARPRRHHPADGATAQRRGLLVRDGHVAAAAGIGRGRACRPGTTSAAHTERRRTPRRARGPGRRRSASPGESECATGSPRRAKTRVLPSITAPCRRPGSPRRRSAPAARRRWRDSSARSAPIGIGRPRVRPGLAAGVVAEQVHLVLAAELADAGEVVARHHEDQVGLAHQLAA